MKSFSGTLGGGTVKRLHRYAVLLALLVMGSVSWATDPTVVLKGRVVDDNGLPVGGAQVKLEVAGGQVFSAVSDDAGFFSIVNFPVGQVTVRVE